jgi:hypothetical protein
MVGAGDLLFRAAARSDRLFVVPVGALMLVDESREERPEEELEPAPEPEVPLAVLVAGFFGAAFLTGPFLTGAFLLVFFFFAAAVAVAFLVTPAALVRGPGAAFVSAGGAAGVLAWICRRGREQVS